MKKLSSLFLLALLPLMASAQTLIDGIYYNLDASTKQATVTSGSFKYTGSVTIPATITYNNVTYSVTEIGYGAFNNCSGLTEVTIPNSVIKIGDQTFTYCTRLTSVTIPNSVTEIGLSAFWGCSGMTEVTIPNSVIKIRSGAFDRTAWYENQPDGVVYAGKVVYNYKGTMPENTSISIEEGTLGVGDYAFLNCSNLTSVTIPNSVIWIGDKALDGTAWYENQLDGVVYAGKIAYKYKGTMPGYTSISIKEGTIGISSGAFNNCTGLISITIPNSVTEIGENAFQECKGLTSVTIPNSVTSIGSYAFYGCKGLTSVTIPNSVTEIRSFAFSGCSGLTEVTIPNSVTEIGSSAFSGCSGLTAVTIPNSVTWIGDGAFSYCSGLTAVTIPNSVTEIGSSAFSYCSGLTEVTIPNSVTEIGLGAFDGTAWYNNQPDGVVYAGKVAYGYKGTMPKNTSISIKEGTLGICSRAFTYKSDLISVTIPNSVTSIGDNAFESCSGLASIVVESGNTKYDSRGNCNAIIETATNTLITGCQNTIFPNSVTEIGKYAFYGCSGLTSVTIPSSVTSIGQCAFMYCYGLTEATIPNGVTEIGKDAFYCSGLTTVYCYAENVPKTGNNIFSSTNIKNGTLYVPSASINSYKWATPWYRFGTIEAISDAGIRGDVNGDGEVNVGDLVSVSNYMAGDDSVSKDAADVNQDGEVNVGDMVVISNIMSGNE